MASEYYLMNKDQNMTARRIKKGERTSNYRDKLSGRKGGIGREER